MSRDGKDAIETLGKELLLAGFGRASSSLMATTAIGYTLLGEQLVATEPEWLGHAL